MKHRAQYAECKLKKEEGKGDAQWMTWKGKEIGKYTGPGLLGHTLVKLRKNQFNWELIFRLLLTRLSNFMKGYQMHVPVVKLI